MVEWLNNNGYLHTQQWGILVGLLVHRETYTFELEDVCDSAKTTIMSFHLF